MTRIYPDDDAVERIARGVMTLSLPKPEWTHAAHFAATLWLLRAEAAAPLEQRMPELIRAYNAATGTPNTDTSGYHETITLASIAAARAFLAAQPADLPLHEALDRLMACGLGRPDWLLAYWSQGRLFSAAARRAWVEPDLAPFNPRATSQAAS
jgi:hypothetical protein